MLSANGRVKPDLVIVDGKQEAHKEGAYYLVVPDDRNGHRSVAAAIADFLDETKLTKKPKTLSVYSTALAYFVESCHKLNLEEVDRKDLLRFHAFLRDDKEQAPRSCWNKFATVSQHSLDLDIQTLLGPLCGLPAFARNSRLRRG